MLRLFVFLFLFTVLNSCSKDEERALPPVVIPDNIDGIVSELNVTPLDITTPDKGSVSILMNNTIYRVAFTATDGAQSNAVIYFANDTILTDNSREFADLGKDAVGYAPVRENEIEIRFKDGRKVAGVFDFNTSFGGTFGEQLIAQWRSPGDPAKPNQKAKDDITQLIQRYSDKDGPGPDTAPIYLFASVSKP